MQLVTIDLTQQDQQEIERLISLSEHSPIELADLWQMMDRIWDELGCDNTNLDPKIISAYYSHPVWTLNGLFIEQDNVSMGHRKAISSWISNHKISNLLDYGGGFGTLARLIATTHKNIKIDIHEPFPSQLAITRMQRFSNINFVGSFDCEYDCVVCIDVLEHVNNPLELFATMIEHVKVGGNLVVANCFHPDIKCHLPSTFHFRHTFDLFAKMMGLQVMGICRGSHATIYKKIEAKKINWDRIRQFEKLSRITFPINEALSFSAKKLKNAAKFLLLK
jgi:2-polyprenyl-3-methyl-5-hydroxy-6-metoxy-1,4-benzoquinol methylase